LLDEAAQGNVDLNAAIAVSQTAIAGGAGIIRYLSGELRFTLLDYAAMMIDLSDNDASNRLIAVLGMEAINAKCKELGLRDTILNRKFMDFEARKQGKENFTSCRDMLIIFETIYRNPEKYGLALKLLKQQMLNDLLPLLTIHNEFEFAHKTGSLDGVRHDAGIMYLENPIFVSFFSKNLKRDEDGIRLANEIGLLIYNEFKQK
jgi:beta-lactamase class A